MQVRCIKAFGNCKPGDLAEVPDGAAVSPEFWEPVVSASVQGAPAAAAPPVADAPPKPPAAPAAVSAPPSVKEGA